jgi:hypothetical protein
MPKQKARPSVVLGRAARWKIMGGDSINRNDTQRNRNRESGASELNIYGLPIPHLPAWQGDYGGLAHTVIWCKFCRIYHRHGAAGWGHRIAHCWKPESEYHEPGYLLCDAGRAPAAVAADLNRQSAGGTFRRRIAAAEFFAVDDSGRIVPVQAAPLPQPTGKPRRPRWRLRGPLV